MADDPRTELDRMIQELQQMEQRAGSATAAGGMLHSARTILLEVARITEFGGAVTDGEPSG
jgi:hypothetical protein